MFVVVTGPPAAGKTTLSSQLARELGLPRLAKDTIKRGLLTVLGAAELAESRRLGAAAVEALLALATENESAVLDSVWVNDELASRLRGLPGPIVEVFCQCPVEELRRRYYDRAEQRQGRLYDFDLERPDGELWNERSMRPLGLGWPVVKVDTAEHVDLPELAAGVRRMAQSG